MSDTPRRILHIGQRKTGTTWFQFGAERAAEAGVLALEHWSVAKWVKGVTAKSASEVDYDALSAILPTNPERPALATCEGLIVHDPAKIAAAVARKWPDAHVLVTTRAPQDYLMSSFNNASMTRHETPAEFAARMGRGHIRRSHDLDGVAAGYGAVFGVDRVHFLPYELLREDADAYIGRLEALFGAPLRDYLPTDKLNASPPAPYLLLARRVNALIEGSAPEILESADWLNFMRVANFSAGAAKGLDRYFEDYFRDGAKVTDALPRLDEATEQCLADQMRVLGGLPHYQPYLVRYGFRPSVPAVPGKAV